LESRYLLRDHEQRLMEEPEHLFSRVANTVAQAELNYRSAPEVALWVDRFSAMMNKLYFLPNSPTLMNAGKAEGQLSACFVLPIEDCIESIFETLKNAAKIQQSGGGTGFDFSELRPRDSWINSTGGLASGPVSFIKIFDCATEHIKQGGKRRGANMAVLNARHPDIVEFIGSKKGQHELNNFNISVGVEDSFMEAVATDQIWELRSPKTGNLAEKVKARKIWGSLIENAWLHGDPGLLFLDRIASGNPTPLIGDIAATNPCGEMPLLPYESCNLGSVNLSLMVDERQARPDINWKLLEDTINTAVRFLDNVIDVNHYLLPETKTVTMGNRKIGLGVMGWAEMLIRLGIPYASDRAVTTAEKLMKFIMQKTRKASEQLAVTRGPFPNWPRSIYSRKAPIRNATRTSIAPTGSISIIANTSSSIEPLFALAFRRTNVLDQTPQVEINRLFIECLQNSELYTDSMISAVSETGQVPRNNDLPNHLVSLFKTALQIPYEYHIKHQVAFQKYTDNAVSKTINLPADCKKSDTSEAYLMAWKLGVKGITVFRTGCREQQVLNPGILPAKVPPDENNQPCKVCIA